MKRLVMFLLVLILSGVAAAWFRSAHHTPVNAARFPAKPMDTQKPLIELIRQSVPWVTGEVKGFRAGQAAVYRLEVTRPPQFYNLVAPASSFVPGEIIQYTQSLGRKGTEAESGKEAYIGIVLEVSPDSKLAYAGALYHTHTQASLVPPSIPEGTFTGFPLGKKSWSAAPRKGSGVSFTARLVVWDNLISMWVKVQYTPKDPLARNLEFSPIEPADLELGEQAARLALARTQWVLLNERSPLSSQPVMADGELLEARRTEGGRVLYPLKALVSALGGTVEEEKPGIYRVVHHGQVVTLPLGAYVLQASGQMRSLALPVMMSGSEIWVEGGELTRALGLSVRTSGNTLVLSDKAS